MARDPQTALLALNRFGFGARGGAAGDLANAAADPRGFVKADLKTPNGVLLDMPGLQPTPALTRIAFAYQDEVKQTREAKKAEASTETPDKEKMSAVATPDKATSNASMQAKEPLNPIQKTFRAEALARLQRALIADCGFGERLVTFWSNHFSISAAKGQLGRIWAGAFEREAIRPHVFGRFADMLKAVEQHPAMLFFLDNQQSLGPDSRAGQNRKRGLNENLAREIMELHTLGVGGGYTQADVTSLARIITGWTFAGKQGQLGTPGMFVFNANAHQPGPQVLLGKSYADTGLAQGEAALADLAHHPSTAKFIATKFARHFVADDPPPTLIARLESSFRKTDGDLRALAATLVDSDEAWQTPARKIRSPYEYLIAAGRLLAQVPDEPSRYLGALNLLGQPLWAPSGPNGFPDTNATWAAPEGMKLRLDIAAQISSRLGDNVDPRDLVELVAADAASQETRQTIARAESRQQALALLLMSPEFQRR